MRKRQASHWFVFGNTHKREAIVESREWIRRRKRNAPLIEINGQNSDDQCIPNGQERIAGLRHDMPMAVYVLPYDGSREGSATWDDLV